MVARLRMDYPIERFTDEERAALTPHFTNLDKPVFALVNLPETVKGALFARYSLKIAVTNPLKSDYSGLATGMLVDGVLFGEDQADRPGHERADHPVQGGGGRPDRPDRRTGRARVGGAVPGQDDGSHGPESNLS